LCYSQIWQNIRGDKYLCKLGKEYLNASPCKFVVYSLRHSETFDVSHDFIPQTIAELSTLKQVWFFWRNVQIRCYHIRRDIYKAPTQNVKKLQFHTHIVVSTRKLRRLLGVTSLVTGAIHKTTLAHTLNFVIFSFLKPFGLTNKNMQQSYHCAVSRRRHLSVRSREIK